MYLGPKHNGHRYDHLPISAGGDFLLYRMQHIAIYVRLLLLDTRSTSAGRILQYRYQQLHSIDADHRPIVVTRRGITWATYQRWFGFQPNTKSRQTLILVCFTALACRRRCIDTTSPPDGLVPNLLAFKRRVEWSA